jgi:hypothetical protein
MNFHTPDTFSLQKPNYCMLFFFHACRKLSSHVNDVSDTRQLNSKGGINRYNKGKILGLWLRSHSAVGLSQKIKAHFADTLYLPSYNSIIFQCKWPGGLGSRYWASVLDVSSLSSAKSSVDFSTCLFFTLLWQCAGGGQEGQGNRNRKHETQQLYISVFYQKA